jgi:hypothetical protein
MADEGAPPPTRPGYDKLRDQIVARLAPLCEAWPRELFDEMVRNLTEITLKYDTTTSLPQQYDRRTTERLVDELREAAERSIQHRKSTGPADSVS